MSKHESLSRKLTLGILYLFSSTTLSGLFTIITLSVTARILGVENFGLYNAFLSIVGLFQFITNLGVNRILLKEGAKNFENAKTSFGNALLFKAIVIVPIILVIILISKHSGYTGNSLLAIVLFGFSLIFDSYGTLFISLRRILGDFKVISIFRVIRSIINLLSVIIALKIDNSVLSLSIATLIVSLISFTGALANSISLLKPKLNLKELWELIEDSIIFGLNDFFSKLYLRASIVLLSMYADLYSVGIFSAGIRFTKFSFIFAKQVRVAILPTMYRILDEKDDDVISESKNLIESNKDRSSRVFKTMLKYMVLISVPLSLIMFFYSSELINIIFGSKYKASTPIVKLLSVFIFLRFIQTPFTLFYLGLNRHKSMVVLQAISCIFLIMCSYVFIPKHHSFGACYAVNISELIFSALLIIYGFKFNIWKIFDLIKFIVLPFLTGITSIYITSRFFNFILIEFFIFIFLYFVFLLATGQLNKRDKDLISKIIFHKKRRINS